MPAIQSSSDSLPRLHVLAVCLLILPAVTCRSQAEDQLSEVVQGLTSSSTTQRLSAAAKVPKLGDAAVQAVPALIDALKCERIEILFASSQIPASRRRFADVLIGVGKPAEPHLLKALTHENGLVRVWAAYALFRTDSQKHGTRTIPVLSAAMTDGTEVAADAARALESIGHAASPSIPYLIDQLSHHDRTVRCHAAHALSQIATGDSSQALATALSNDNALTRVGAAFALQQIDSKLTPRTVAEITNALQSESPDVRRQAVWAIGQMGPAAHPLVPKLIDALPNLDPDPRAYYFGGRLGRTGTDPALALAAIGAPAAEALTQALKHKNSRMRVLCAVALQRIDPAQQAHTAPILKVARDDMDEMIRAIAAMSYSAPVSGGTQDMETLIQEMLKSSRFGPPSRATGRLIAKGSEAVEPLMKLFDSGDGLVAGKAARVLARIGEPALPALNKAMQSDRDQLRLFAVRSLAQMRRPPLETLIAALKDASYPVRRAARYALLGLGTPEALDALRASKSEGK